MSTPNEALLSLLRSLLKCPSITPDHAGSLDIIVAFCEQIGGSCRRIDRGDTANLLVSFGGKHIPLLFCGHVDVVSPGDEDDWHYPPFSATVKDGCVFGRGAVDMKGSIAAFLHALNECYTRGNKLASFGLLITSDEEGSAVDGTQYALEVLHQEGYRFDYGLVGEPTSSAVVGDTIKVGRRGSLSATITVEGKQGHVAYAELARNPIHTTNTLLQALLAYPWACDIPHFPATQCVCMHIDANNTLLNVIPQRCQFSINFRYSPYYTAKKIKQLVTHIIAQYTDTYHTQWRHSAEPFYSAPGKFADICSSAIASVADIRCEVSTNGGTSDARFVRHYVEEIVELGPKNNTAHQNNEYISTDDLASLAQIYQAIVQRFT